MVASLWVLSMTLFIRKSFSPSSPCLPLCLSCSALNAFYSRTNRKSLCRIEITDMSENMFDIDFSIWIALTVGNRHFSVLLLLQVVAVCCAASVRERFLCIAYNEKPFKLVNSVDTKNTHQEWGSTTQTERERDWERTRDDGRKQSGREVKRARRREKRADWRSRRGAHTRITDAFHPNSLKKLPVYVWPPKMHAPHQP